MKTTVIDASPDSLDAAWAAVGRLLPENWTIWLKDDLGGGWVATARIKGLWWMKNGPEPRTDANGATPVEALRNLAAALEAK